MFWNSLKGFLGIKYRVGRVTFSSRGKNLKVGVGSLSDVISISSTTSMTIGNFTCIGKNLSVLTAGDHNPDRISSYSVSWDLADGTGDKHLDDWGSVEIGNDVWIGEDVTIMGGVKIGDGAVVGAKSFVPKSKKLDDYGIYAGVPARLIRYRFDKAMIKKLKELRWWDLDTQLLSRNWTLFYERPEVAYKKLLALKIKSQRPHDDK